MEITDLERCNNRVEGVRAPVLSGARARSPFRIAHVIPGSVVGGAEIATLRVARALEESGEFQCVAFCHGGNTQAARLFAENSLETASYTAGEFSYRRPVPYVRGVLRLVRQLRRRQVDLVHCAELMGLYHAGLAAKLLRLPVVCHVRSNFEDCPAHYKLPFLAADHFAFVSQAAWRNFDQIYRVPRHRGTVIYDWAPVPDGDADMMEPCRARVRREFGLGDDAPVIGMVARVAPEKDFETLLAATARVVAAKPDTRLLLIGENKQPESCRLHYEHLCRLIAEQGLTGHVIWTGFRQDVPALLRAIDVLVHATHSEGFGLVLVEAMALGIPVVATRIGGVPEIVSDGETGLLYAPGDAADCARQLLRAIGDRQLADSLSRRGRESARSLFTREQTVSAVRGLYLRLLGGMRVGVTRDGERLSPQERT